jgi:nicotinate-nucleotide adenylyltransferase
MSTDNIDYGIIMPTNIPPHKEKHSSTSCQDRYHMCQLAVKSMDGFEGNITVSDIEIKQRGKSYTALTIEKLRHSYHEDELVLLMGEDMLLTLDRWYKPEIIINEAEICCVKRSADGDKRISDKINELRIKYANFKCTVLQADFIDISSTEIREICRKHDFNELKKVVPEEVAEYIISKRLYQ